jgi:hypothetical protein
MKMKAEVICARTFPVKELFSFFVVHFKLEAKLPRQKTPRSGKLYKHVE